MSIGIGTRGLLGPLEDAARGVILERLLPALPAAPHDQQDFFEPYLGDLPKGQVKMLAEMARNLRRTLVYRNGLFPLGLLAFCLEATHPPAPSLSLERGWPQPGVSGNPATVGGVFAAIRKSFTDLGGTDFSSKLNTVKEFRNKYIAHAEEELTDRELARKQLGIWLAVLAEMHSPATSHESRAIKRDAIKPHPNPSPREGPGGYWICGGTPHPGSIGMLHLPSRS